MLLNQDVVGLILDLLGDHVTLLSTTLRDRYFKKHGIWVKLGLYIYRPHFRFPKKFYSYPVNLCLDRICPDILLKTGIKCYLEDCYGTDADKLVDHLYKQTQFIQNTSDKVTLGFPNVKSVKNVQFLCDKEVVSELIRRRINGFTLVIRNIEACIELSKLENINYNIMSINDCMIDKIPDNIASRVIRCYYHHIGKNTTYSNLKSLKLYSDIVDVLGINRFPKLKTIICDELNPVYFNEKLEGIIFSANYNGSYTPEMWRRITKSGAKLNLHLRFQFLDKDIVKNKKCINSISIIYDDFVKPPLINEPIYKFVSFYSGININVYLHFCSAGLLEKFLGHVSFINSWHGNRKINVCGMNGYNVDIIREAIRIYNKNKIFLDFDNLCDTKLVNTTDRDLAYYWKIKKTYQRN